ncbi:MAG: hypothetical protein MK080_10320 [Opitutales bacterium]|nr:hypothetical protein [Opitutales bacterium]NRA28568.1 hypothetical protein [Opitutales bacterium]
MNSNQWFYDNCNPATWARPTTREWEACESVLGFSLPPEYRAIIDFVGMGFFGDLVLFNPKQELNPEVRLPGACAESYRWLYENALYSEIELDAHWEFPSTSAIVLGGVNGDEYLFWSESGWFFI